MQQFQYNLLNFGFKERWLQNKLLAIASDFNTSIVTATNFSFANRKYKSFQLQQLDFMLQHLQLSVLQPLN